MWRDNTMLSILEEKDERLIFTVRAWSREEFRELKCYFLFSCQARTRLYEKMSRHGLYSSKKSLSLPILPSYSGRRKFFHSLWSKNPYPSPKILQKAYLPPPRLHFRKNTDWCVQEPEYFTQHSATLSARPCVIVLVILSGFFSKRNFAYFDWGWNEDQRTRQFFLLKITISF